MHALKLRSAQCLRCFACVFYGHTVHYGCAGMVHAELKKEMGLQHVSGDYNHRKQEHNCLQYTDSRKCTAREGQEDGERGRWMEQRMRGRYLLMKHQKLRWRQRQDRDIFFPHPFPFLQYILNHRHERLHKSVCERLRACLVCWMENSASADLSDHQIAFVAFGNRINTLVRPPISLDSYLYIRLFKLESFLHSFCYLMFVF